MRTPYLDNIRNDAEQMVIDNNRIKKETEKRSEEIENKYKKEKEEREKAYKEKERSESITFALVMSLTTSFLISLLLK